MPVRGAALFGLGIITKFLDFFERGVKDLCKSLLENREARLVIIRWSKKSRTPTCTTAYRFLRVTKQHHAGTQDIRELNGRLKFPRHFFQQFLQRVHCARPAGTAPPLDLGLAGAFERCALAVMVALTSAGHSASVLLTRMVGATREATSHTLTPPYSPPCSGQMHAMRPLR